MVETRQKINLWAASHEKKWRRVPTKLEENKPVHREGNTSSMHRPRFTYGGEGVLIIVGRRKERITVLERMEEFTHLCQ